MRTMMEHVTMQPNVQCITPMAVAKVLLDALNIQLDLQADAISKENVIRVGRIIHPALSPINKIIENKVI